MLAEENPVSGRARPRVAEVRGWERRAPRVGGSGPRGRARAFRGSGEARQSRGEEAPRLIQ